VEHGYPMGPMMGRENALMKSAVWGLLGGWVEHGYPMSLCWMGGSVLLQLFVIHAKEERTKTSVVVEINTSTRMQHKHNFLYFNWWYSTNSIINSR
jgi:hypothetical protein